MLTAASGLVSGIVTARVLGPELRGEFAAVVVWTTVLSMAGDFGIGFAVSYTAGRRERPIGEVWTQAVLWGAGLGAMLAVAAALIVPRMLRVQTVGPAMLALGFSAIPFMLGASYQSYLLLGVGRVAESNLVRLVAALGYAGAVVACAATRVQAVPPFILAFWGAQAVAFLTATALVARSVRPRWSPSRATGIALLRHGARTQIASAAAQATLRLDQLALSTAFPPEALGLYAVAVAFAAATGPVFSAAAILVIPHALAAECGVPAVREVVRFLKLGAVVGVPLAVAGVAVAPWILPVMVGDSFVSAIVPAQILLVAGLFQGWNAVLGNGLRALGRPGAPARAEILGLAITVVLLLILLPRWGIQGAAITSLLAYAGVAAAQLWSLVSGAGESVAGLVRAPLRLGELLFHRRRAGAVDGGR